jgi:aldehyde:ferredoxin oxidoreductase
MGERIFNVERCFNVRENFNRKNDALPKRFLDEEFPAGFAKGQTVDLEKMLHPYYQLRGWDEEGIPKEEKLKELGITHSF